MGPVSEQMLTKNLLAQSQHIINKYSANVGVMITVFTKVNNVY